MSKIWTAYAFVMGDHVMELCMFTVGSYQEARRIANEVFGEECLVIDATNIRVKRDDTYHDGYFWHTDSEGVEHKLEPVPSEEEMLEALQTETTANTTNIESNTTAIDDILIMLLDSSTDTTTDTTEETV